MGAERIRAMSNSCMGVRGLNKKDQKWSKVIKGDQNGILQGEESLVKTQITHPPQQSRRGSAIKKGSVTIYFGGEINQKNNAKGRLTRVGRREAIKFDQGVIITRPNSL